ncbi:MAG: NYN domain-containing protein [Chloroflexi bacterium]|nr:NYN domain-containing protein [Chloroflexota bacterium]MBU1662380.1 NYN domain-containing protein [Chloroflexota bacterium]
MSYLIDGHNLIPKIPGLSLQAIDDEVQLIKRLKVFSRQHRKRVDVYFDNAPAGQSHTRKFGSVTAHFVRQGRTADEAIYTRLRDLGRSARNWAVVSSDREVQAAARDAHAQVISSEVFAQELEQPAGGKRIAPSGPESDANLALSQEEVNDWLRLFGADGAE